MRESANDGMVEWGICADSLAVPIYHLLILEFRIGPFFIRSFSFSQIL